MVFRIALIVLAYCWAAFPQQVKRVTASPTSKTSGPEMYKAYCSPCHGLQGKGDGPAAPALKKQPTDLSTLAKTNKGKFPAGRITSTLNAAGTPAHGSQEMPIWGDVFRAMEHDTASVNMRIMNVTRHIEALQQK
jgi:mono/diheme cytochrome c family protein